MGESAVGAAPPTVVSATRASAGPLAGRDFVEVRFGGSGGQGVILMGVILAVAATRDHRYVIQTQSYGPEARGGYSRSDVIISDRHIDYPELLGIDLLVALSDEAAHHYVPALRATGIFLFDSDEVRDPPLVCGVTYGVPFTRLALEVTGRAQTANIVTLGTVVGLTGVVGAASLEQSVLGMVPPGTEELNLAAMRRGLELSGEEWRRESASQVPRGYGDA